MESPILFKQTITTHHEISDLIKTPAPPPQIVLFYEILIRPFQQIKCVTLWHLKCRKMVNIPFPLQMDNKSYHPSPTHSARRHFNGQLDYLFNEVMVLPGIHPLSFESIHPPSTRIASSHPPPPLPSPICIISTHIIRL